MISPLQKCINNNHLLYQAVFNRMGIEYHRNDDIWYCLEPTPPLYSNIVTHSPDWRPDHIFHEIDSRFAKENWNKWSMKDSFGVLDLAPHGLTKLFDAKWLYLDISKFTPVEKSVGLRYEIVDTVEAFDEWRLGWDPDEALSRRIFSAELIWDLWFIAGYDGDSLRSGCLVNPSDGIRGISNFFAPGDDPAYWSDMISFIREALGGYDIVGYERDIEKLQALGFDSPGDLSVWVKTGQNRER